MTSRRVRNVGFGTLRSDRRRLGFRRVLRRGRRWRGGGGRCDLLVLGTYSDGGIRISVSLCNPTSLNRVWYFEWFNISSSETLSADSSVRLETCVWRGVVAGDRQILYGVAMIGSWSERG